MQARAHAALVLGGLALLAPLRAGAEEGEWAAGLGAGLFLPSVAAQDRTAFRLATWMLAAGARYGLGDDLDLTARAMWGSFAGSIEEARGELVGRRVFRAEQVGGRIGARYKLLAGHDVAPYLEGELGYQWMILRAQDFRNEAGESYGLALPDEGQGAWTLTAGGAVDLRLFNLAFVGVALRYTEVLGFDLYRRFVTIPFEVNVYW